MWKLDQNLFSICLPLGLHLSTLASVRCRGEVWGSALYNFGRINRFTCDTCVAGDTESTGFIPQRVMKQWDTSTGARKLALNGRRQCWFSACAIPGLFLKTRLLFHVQSVAWIDYAQPENASFFIYCHFCDCQRIAAFVWMIFYEPSVQWECRAWNFGFKGHFRCSACFRDTEPRFNISIKVNVTVISGCFHTPLVKKQNRCRNYALFHFQYGGRCHISMTSKSCLE